MRCPPQDIKRQLACIAGPMIFQVSPEDVVFEDQKASPRDGNRSQGISYSELLLKHFGIKAINPLGCRQQLRGAATMGMGQALLEEIIYQEGLLINPNFLDYNLPRFLDLPEEMIAILVERPHVDGPHGAKRSKGE